MLMMQRWGIRTVPMPGVEVLADEEENEAEAEAGKQLEACEDHLKVKQHIASMWKDLSPAADKSHN